MLPLQRMIADDGYEVALFPFEYLYMTQDEGGDTSHTGTYNIDFQGWGSNGRIYKCPYYAPCTLKCVNTTFDTSNHNIVFESVSKVHLADGTLDYLTIAFGHDDEVPYQVGDIIPQGNLLGHTGTYGNVTGDHTHSCCGKGTYQGYTQRASGNWDLTNRIHYWNAVYTNNTVIVEGFNHNWREYQGGITPYASANSKFNWVLFNKIRKFR